MKVLKFGGSSVANAENINKVVNIVFNSVHGNEGMVVVVSALGGVTDELIKLVTFASKKDIEYKIMLRNICERHDLVVKELIKKEKVQDVLTEVSKKYKELEEVVNKIFDFGELSKILLDSVMSYGEQLSSYIICEVVKSSGLNSEFIDARDIIKTDNNFGEGNVDIDNSYKAIFEKIKDNQVIYVMGGFMASTKEGITTTLGRGGSDYTASLVGAALNASAIEIWTDVDGLLTADPRKVKNAVTIPEVSYEKAEKMALSGAKVIHPKTMKPARLKGIPIFIRNTFNPNGNGTKIK